MEEASFECALQVFRACVDDVRLYAANPEISALSSALAAFLKWAYVESGDLKQTNFESQSNVWTGARLVTVLDNCQLTPETMPALLKTFGQLSEAEDEETGGAMLNGNTIAVLSSFFTVLKFLFAEARFVQDYRLVLQRTAQSGEWGVQICLWCLNPAICFQNLSKAHCILLTSGTLSPMTSFDSELECKFPIRMSWQGLGMQALVAAQVKVGSAPLDARWQQSEKLDYQDLLGETIRRYISVIPAGVLVFLPSYGFQQKLIDRWQATGELEKMQTKKKIFLEPRGSGEEFDRMLQSYYLAVKHGGAVMFAVCRGKVSEGIDFADDNARGVLAVGIPFPNVQDLRVQLKKAHNTQHSKDRQLLDGKDWYVLQGYRALNQALGRCIRHKLDFGAVILLDSRFQDISTRSSLSQWARTLLRVGSLEENIAAIEAFFAQHQATFVPNSTWEEKVPSAKLLPPPRKRVQPKITYSSQSTLYSYLQKKEESKTL